MSDEVDPPVRLVPKDEREIESLTPLEAVKRMINDSYGRISEIEDQVEECGKVVRKYVDVDPDKALLFAIIRSDLNARVSSIRLGIKLEIILKRITEVLE